MKYYKIRLWNHNENDETEINFFGFKSQQEAWSVYTEKKEAFESMLIGDDFADGSVYEMTAEECDRLGYGRFR